MDLQPSAELTEASEDKYPNLRRFPKGVSGNPGGKLKGKEDVRALARKHGVAAFNRIVELIDSDDERVAMMAAKEVLDRAYGKPKTAEDEDARKGSVTVNIIRYTDGSQPATPVESQAISVRTLAIP
jgi:hypothetical protein